MSMARFMTTVSASSNVPATSPAPASSAALTTLVYAAFWHGSVMAWTAVATNAFPVHGLVSPKVCKTVAPGVIESQVRVSGLYVMALSQVAFAPLLRVPR